jgi:oligopeptide/dipeptide ABC transporter ATP-binding protein
MHLLDLVNVSKSFRSGGLRVDALRNVSLSVDSDKTVGLIGESGSGKSTLARIAIGLITPDSGHAYFDGTDLTTLSNKDLRRRRMDMRIVFQEPYESLNPRMRVHAIVQEALDIYRPNLSEKDRGQLTDATLDKVNLNVALRTRFPRELSGGEQQRVGIARAIVTNPRFIVLDEPTSSLDLSMRAGILQLLGTLRAEYGMGCLFVSHDMSTVDYIADSVVVLYRGQVVEQGPRSEVTSTPAHPYTQALLDSRMSVDPRKRRVVSASTAVRPAAAEGCSYYARCPVAEQDCAAAPIPLIPIGTSSRVACLHVEAARSRRQMVNQADFSVSNNHDQGNEGEPANAV